MLGNCTMRVQLIVSVVHSSQSLHLQQAQLKTPTHFFLLK